MKRVTLYSSSKSSKAGWLTPGTHLDQLDRVDQVSEIPSAHRADRQSRISRRNFYARGPWLRWIAAGGLCALLLLFAYAAIAPSARQIAQEDIRAAVRHTLETHTLPSPAAKAYAVIRPAVVRVRRMDPENTGGADIE